MRPAFLAVITVSMVCASSTHAQTPSEAVKRFISVEEPTVALVHVRVVDGTGAAPAEDQTVVVSDGKIAAVGPAGRRECPRALRCWSCRTTP